MVFVTDQARVVGSSRASKGGGGIERHGWNSNIEILSLGCKRNLTKFDVIKSGDNYRVIDYDLCCAFHSLRFWCWADGSWVGLKLGCITLTLQSSGLAPQWVSYNDCWSLYVSSTLSVATNWILKEEEASFYTIYRLKKREIIIYDNN